MARCSTKISTEGKPLARSLRLSKAQAEAVKGLTKEQRLELPNRKLDDQLDALNGWLDARGLPYDEARAYRAMLTWLDGDKLALDAVLAEVMTDPTGTPSLLFVLLDTATAVSATLDPDAGVRLRAPCSG